MMKTSCFEKQERWNHSYCLPVLLISQERASGAQGLNLVNSYNAEHFNLVLIPKLNFEKTASMAQVWVVLSQYLHASIGLK